MKLLVATALVFACCFVSSCSYFKPSRTERFISYKIKKGDTLSLLSERFDVPVDTLRDINSVSDPKKLAVGSTILFPYARSVGPLRSSSKASESKMRIPLGRTRRYVGELKTPTKNFRLSSGFGKRWGTFHEGLDFAASSGTPVVAAHEGLVVYSGRKLSGYGNLIVIKGDDLLTVYAHNRRNYVSSGQRVAKGDRIAELGSTGKSSGPHLHFETRIKDSRGKFRAVDPKVFFPSGFR
jgi:murein DD-endopeptidase MepM/ murein hydrolase activator NlpD